MTHRRRALLFSSAALCAGSCSPDAPAGDGVCVDYAAVTGSPSFAADVVPVFQSTCDGEQCHDSGAAEPREELRLGFAGRAMTEAEIDEVHAGLVGVASRRAALDLVAPGDPTHSWLLAKLEYDDFADCAEIVCTAVGCGARMPPGVGPLDAAALGAIRAWIKAGAKNQ